MKMSNYQKCLVLVLAFFSSYKVQALEIDSPVMQKAIVGLPESPAEAAAVLQHRLENAGYILAVVGYDESGNLLLANGRITELKITGASELVEIELRRLLNSVLNKTDVHLDELEFHLSVAGDLHGVNTSFALERIVNSDDYMLEVMVTEHKQSGIFSVDNSPRNGLSVLRANLHQEFYSTFEGGDVIRLNANWNQTDGPSDDQVGLNLSYQTFIGEKGRFIEFNVGRSAPTSDFALAGSGINTSDYIGAVWGREFSRNQGSSVVAYAEGQLTHDRANHSETRLIRGSYFTRNDFSVGDAQSFGATLTAGQNEQANQTNKDFYSLRLGYGSIQTMPSISNSAELLFDLYGQLGSKDTPAEELIYAGGSQSLRGFETGQYEATSGLIGTFELGWLGQLYGHTLKPFAFLDAGYIENQAEISDPDQRPRNNTMASIGLGSDLYFKNSTSSVRGWLGKPIYDERSPEPGVAFYVQFQTAW